MLLNKLQARLALKYFVNVKDEEKAAKKRRDTFRRGAADQIDRTPHTRDALAHADSCCCAANGASSKKIPLAATDSVTQVSQLRSGFSLAFVLQTQGVVFRRGSVRDRVRDRGSGACFLAAAASQPP